MLSFFFFKSSFSVEVLWLCSITQEDLKVWRNSSSSSFIKSAVPFCAYLDNLEKSYSREQDRKQDFSLPNTESTQMLAAHFLSGEPRSPFVSSKFAKPLSFQLFCYGKMIIQLSTMTACWKTRIMDNVGAQNSNQAT